MAGSNKYAYYSNSALKTYFSQDQAINTDWFDAITRTEYTQNNISVSGSSENIKYFSV
jgi:hypothetical protein